MEIPAMMMVVARAIAGLGTRRPPNVTAMVQKPPRLMPNNTRPRSITVKLGASAEIKFETTSKPIKPSTSVRRSTRPAPTVMTGAATAATKPGIVTMSPAVPWETCSPAEIRVSKPMGRNSEVTRTNAPRDTVSTASHDCQAGR